MSQSLSQGALALIVACAATLANAQVPLSALSLQARSYESAINWQESNRRPAGLPEVIRIPGHVLVDVRAVFDGPWSDDVERVNVNTRDIHLVLPDGTELSPIGGFQNWGQLQLLSLSFSGRRPRNFPDEDADLHWNGTFRVPKGIATARLVIGGDAASFSGDLTIPGPTAEADAASFATFRPTGVRRFRTVNLQDGRGSEAVTSSITAPAGMVLAEVEIEVTGVAGNQNDGDDRFTWHTHNYRLVDANGQSMGLVGERFMQRLLDSQYNGVDVGASAERTVLWLVPEGLSEARLLFGETEVARVALAGAPITETD
ncbi:MAG: hypothetical protein H6899_04250 [Rhodobacter sp.]|nr:hypothetical protein [Paracoccaceae bacterium]MCC0079161.1 hypothetical protein [Rhodobacter sp.]